MTEIWWLLPLLNALLLSLITGPLGCFVIWRRMAFMGETLAHGALLGITLSLLMQLNMNLAIALSCLLLGFVLMPLQGHRLFASDTSLSIISHTTLALGLVLLSFADGIRIDLLSYLFGDLLASGMQQLNWLFAVALCVAGILLFMWRGLLAVAINPEMAMIEGYAVKKLNLTLILMLALVIAVAMKIVGLLLVSALLVIPAASARSLAQTPKQMVLLASLLGFMSVVLGMLMSYWYDTPAGPSIVLACSALFVISLLLRSQS